MTRYDKYYFKIYEHEMSDKRVEGTLEEFLIKEFPDRIRQAYQFFASTGHIYTSTKIDVIKLYEIRAWSISICKSIKE